jgi:tripartite-type tricarboxylate transporter receptor subunit TctC
MMEENYRQMMRVVRKGACAMMFTGVAMMSVHATDIVTQYPVRPVRMIVTFPPGGATDMVARLLGQQFSDGWGQQFVVDNRAGGGGIIGTEIAARAAPDGYTLLVGSSSGLVINPLLASKLPYDPVKDFLPVSLLSVNPTLLVAHPAVPASSVKELVALAKSRPGKLNYASVGQGSPVHLTMEWFKQLTGTDIVHIPYKGSTPAVTDLVGGQVQLMFNSIPPVLPLVKAGKLKAIAVGTAQRSRTVPEVPTIAESGVPGFDSATWFGLFAPAGTPLPIVAKLSTQAAGILSQPDVAQRLAAQGSDPRGSTPEALAQYMREESARWSRVIKSAAIKVD